VTGDSNQTLQVGEVQRTYLLHVPASYDGTQPVALVLAFHGALGTGLGMSRLTAFSELSDRKGFVVAYPDGLNRQWNDGRPTRPLGLRNADDVKFVSTLVEHLSQTLHIDPKRVYAAGISNGAMLSHRLGCELSDKIAAIGPVAGTIPQNLAGDCAAKAPVSVIMFHGTGDPLVPFNGGAILSDPLSQVLSVSDTELLWAKVNGCPFWPQIATEAGSNPADPSYIQRRVYGPCPNGSEVVSYRIEGGGHTWPGGIQYLPERIIGTTTREINATEIIWDFFEQHPRS
jgi:polyhydroxybutyrate depolymerase